MEIKFSQNRKNESRVKEISNSFYQKQIICNKINSFFSSSKLKLLESSYQKKINEMENLLTDFHQIFNALGIINELFFTAEKNNKSNINHLKNSSSIVISSSTKPKIKKINTTTPTTGKINNLLNKRYQTKKYFRTENKHENMKKNFSSANKKNKTNYFNKYISLTNFSNKISQISKNRFKNFFPNHFLNLKCQGYTFNKTNQNIKNVDNSVNSPHNSGDNKKINRMICNTEYDNYPKITRLFVEDAKNLVLFRKDKRKNKITKSNKFFMFLLDYKNLNSLKKLYDFLYLNENLKNGNIFKNFKGPLRNIYLNKCLKEINHKIEKIEDELKIKKDDVSLMMEREIVLHKYHKIKDFINENDKFEKNRKLKNM